MSFLYLFFRALLLQNICLSQMKRSYFSLSAQMSSGLEPLVSTPGCADPQPSEMAQATMVCTAPLLTSNAELQIKPASVACKHLTEIKGNYCAGTRTKDFDANQCTHQFIRVCLWMNGISSNLSQCTLYIPSNLSKWCSQELKQQ